MEGDSHETYDEFVERCLMQDKNVNETFKETCCEWMRRTRVYEVPIEKSTKRSNANVEDSETK